jgi:hypothetical protein
MSFASDGRELRGGVLSMIETHIVMSLLIFHLVLILMFHLAFTLVLRLALFHVPVPASTLEAEVPKATTSSTAAVGESQVEG